MTDATRYPLSWPTGWKRSVRGGARVGRFTKYGKWLTVSQGIDRLSLELERIGAREVIISSNIELGARGFPLSGRGEPDDRGVAAYFKMKGKDRVLACDTFTTVADNMAGIAAHIECLRGIDRYGVGTLDQAFAGYDALPAPGADNRAPWRVILGFEGWEGSINAKDIEGHFRVRARTAHPDTGGSNEAMAALNEARDAALRELAT